MHSSSPALPARVLLAGCGDLGSKVGALLHAGGIEVTGLRRRAAGTDVPFPVMSRDLSAPDGEALPEVDAVVVALTSDTSDAAGYKRTYRQGLKGLAAALPHRGIRVIYVSSTSVLGTLAGQCVTEETVPQPERATARVLLDAENLARELFPNLTVLRPAGIYGPGRTRLIHKVRSGEPVDHGLITNRIHRDDLAAVIVQLLRQPQPIPLLHAVDKAPVPLGEVLSFIAAQLGVPSPPDSGSGSPHGKRIDARMMHHLMEPQGLKYPTYREGYLQVLVPPS
ncbi:SDR family oxidoreductase [Nesterenkonia massiliensis]|uniref:SDR family oxidoreductase n=1 Tax=Nesterenkonia massiliensis TaxID=1232429 RepID=A0ABT2HRJ2_9MICC|nr:SDR family oxidoreductase [Nesterenkonia massiliensis]MCT1607313.1 SDR family oxidoreductase [Nesterenkonia massiliensis]